MIEKILDKGWKLMDAKFQHKNRNTFEKGNYWLTLDTRHDYVDNNFIEITVRDPALEMEKVGDNRGTPWFSFKYNGIETLDTLEKLLIF